ncbi:MAG: hypothetical protein KF698_10635 [Anaerolineales bacterium]|nr:hypothetical protein [Anaerolineales bacterium]
MPEKRNVPSLKRAIVWGLLVVVIFAAILLLNGMPIRVSDGLQAVQSPDPLSNQDEYFAHWQMVVFQRVLEIAPAGAYRGPVLGHRFEVIVMDTRVKVEMGAVVQSHTIERDSDSGMVLSELILDGTQRIMYDGSGYLSYSAVDEPPAPFRDEVSFVEYAKQRGLEIARTEISEWGGQAWVVESEETGDLEEILSSYNETSRPYLSDLDVIGFHYTWIVDQQLERVVRFEWEAITPSGSVLLQRTSYERPVVLTADEMPVYWLLPSVTETGPDR